MYVRNSSPPRSTTGCGRSAIYYQLAPRRVRLQGRELPACLCLHLCPQNATRGFASFLLSDKTKKIRSPLFQAQSHGGQAVSHRRRLLTAHNAWASTSAYGRRWLLSFTSRRTEQKLSPPAPTPTPIPSHLIPLTTSPPIMYSITVKHRRYTKHKKKRGRNPRASSSVTQETKPWYSEGERNHGIQNMPRQNILYAVAAPPPPARAFPHAPTHLLSTKKQNKSAFQAFSLQLQYIIPPLCEKYARKLTFSRSVACSLDPLLLSPNRIF